MDLVLPRKVATVMGQKCKKKYRAKQKKARRQTLHCTGAFDKSLVDLPNRAKAEAVLAALPPPSQAVSRARTCEGPNFDGS